MGYAPEVRPESAGVSGMRGIRPKRGRGAPKGAPLWLRMLS